MPINPPPELLSVIAGADFNTLSPMWRTEWQLRYKALVAAAKRINSPG